MIQSRREYLRQQRLRRRRIFYISCLAFFLIVAILIAILIGRITGSDDAVPVSDQITESSKEESTETVTPETGTSLEEKIDISASISGDWIHMIHANVRKLALERSVPVVPVPNGYELRFMTPQDIHKGELLLINKQYAYEFLDFSDSLELVSMYDIMSDTYDVSGTDVMLQNAAAESMDLMLRDFYDNTWMSDLVILCGYRTKEESQELYDASAAENGKDHAERRTLPPAG